MTTVEDVTRRLSNVEASQFVNAVVRVNPHLRGAPVADVVAILDDHDAYLDRREPFWDAHAGDLLAAGHPREAIAAASILGAVLTDTDDAMVAMVRRLLRARS